MKTSNFVNDGYKKVGVMVSGGLDSGLLLYLIVKEQLENNNFTVDALTVHRSDNAESHAKRIISVVENYLDTKIESFEVGDPNTSVDNQVISGVVDAILYKNYDILFLATTAVPEHLHSCLDVPKRDDNEYPRLSQPWAHLTKDNTVKYIKEHNLVNLFESSHSCTGLQLGQCGLCFNCIERKWSFDKNKLTDTSKF